jgi:hypothetical protein
MSICRIYRFLLCPACRYRPSLPLLSTVVIFKTPGIKCKPATFLPRKGEEFTHKTGKRKRRCKRCEYDPTSSSPDHVTSLTPLPRCIVAMLSDGVHGWVRIPRATTQRPEPARSTSTCGGCIASTKMSKGRIAGLLSSYQLHHASSSTRTFSDNSCLWRTSLSLRLRTVTLGCSGSIFLPAYVPDRPLVTCGPLMFVRRYTMRIFPSTLYLCQTSKENMTSLFHESPLHLRPLDLKPSWLLLPTGLRRPES